MTVWSLVGLVVVGVVAYRFIKALGNSIPILELLLLISGMQWIIGAYLEYRTDFQHFKYYMYVPEDVYMSYVVPAYVVFVLIVSIAIRKTRDYYPPSDNFHLYSKFGIQILVLGIFSDVLKSSVPGGLQFVFFLLANLKYVGAIILFYSKKPRHIYIFYATLLYLLFTSLRGGFFHELIIWGTFFYMFWAYKNKPTFKFNIIIIVVGLFMGTVIQAVKSDYRDMIWSGYQGNYATLFLDILTKKISGGLTEESEQQEELNVRLNQGWIISAIMDHTPRVQAYSGGETVQDAISASLLPRFLSPNKKIAGGVENFEKFTGIDLAKNTSMGMSLVGEGYANYGRFGGVIFMGLWGLVLVFFWLFLNKQVKINNIILFFLPLVFIQVVKAETELVVVLNHLIKSSILVFGLLWFGKKVLNLNFENE
ncbi:hypothetical protein MWU76_04455 [Gelidibacter sp. F2691]|nr:hypothetical protein [Gelidibacter sp. F2691]